MLGKLLKYEIKATSRIFLPIYLALTVFAIINRFMNFNADTFNISQGIALTLYIFILVGMFVVSFVVVIQRFYKNLLSEEGYLMFTLPVNHWAHIVSKSLTSLMWTILSFIAAFISIVIIALQGITLPELFRELSQMWDELYRYLGPSIWHAIIQMIIGFIIGTLCSNMLIYVSIALGHLSNNHKILASVGSFLGIYALGNVLSGTIAVNAIPQFSPSPSALMDYPFGPFWLAIGLCALYTIVYFVVTNLILSKRLNLE
jgi:hypothetical protein